MGSQHAVRGILSVSLALYLVGTILNGASSLAQISSSLINNSIRKALFFAQAATALPMGAILTVYLGLMGFGSERFLPQSLVLRPEFTQYIPLVVLMLFYLILLIIPYFVGLEGRRRSEIAIYRNNLNRIVKIIDAVGVPSDQDTTQLTMLRDEFRKQAADWKSTEPIFLIKEECDKVQPGDDIDENLRVVYEAYHTFKDQDPRFIGLEAMQELDRKLDEMIGEYNLVSLHHNRLQLSIDLNRSLEGHFKDQRQYYESRMKAAEDMKVLAPVLARSAALLGAAPVVLQYGQRLIKLLPISQ